MILTKLLKITVSGTKKECEETFAMIEGLMDIEIKEIKSIKHPHASPAGDKCVKI